MTYVWTLFLVSAINGAPIEKGDYTTPTACHTAGQTYQRVDSQHQQWKGHRCEKMPLPYRKHH